MAGHDPGKNWFVITDKLLTEPCQIKDKLLAQLTVAQLSRTSLENTIPVGKQHHRRLSWFCTHGEDSSISWLLMLVLWSLFVAAVYLDLQVVLVLIWIFCGLSFSNTSSEGSSGTVISESHLFNGI